MQGPGRGPVAGPQRPPQRSVPGSSAGASHSTSAGPAGAWRWRRGHPGTAPWGGRAGLPCGVPVGHPGGRLSAPPGGPGGPLGPALPPVANLQPTASPVPLAMRSLGAGSWGAGSRGNTCGRHSVHGVIVVGLILIEGECCSCYASVCFLNEYLHYALKKLKLLSQ